MFINYTNHPSARWSEKQRAEAEKYGEIIDIPFPEVSPFDSVEKVEQRARLALEKIEETLGDEKENSVVLCQGEYGLVYGLVKLLQQKQIKVVSAVSERVVNEYFENGISRKIVEFNFQGFREYFFSNKKGASDLKPSVYRVPQGGRKEDRILIVPIGAGSYQNTTYLDDKDNEIKETWYAFDAIVKKENPSKLILAGTVKSGWTGIVEWYGKGIPREAEQELQKTRILIKHLSKQKENGVLDEADQAEIEEHIKKYGQFEDVQVALLPNGSNEEELKEYFDQLQTALSKTMEKERSTHVIFDISNGFRSIPLYIVMLVKYLGLIKNTELSYSMYYGMFEAKTEKGTPLVNLTMVSELTEWINAISEFRNFGSVKALFKCLEREKNNEQKTGKNIENLIRIFKEFDYALNSNNFYYLEKGTNDIIKMQLAEYPLSNQAKLMLQNLQDDFKSRFENNTPYKYSYLQVRLAELYMEQGRWGVAAIALQESIITYAMERYLKEYFSVGTKDIADYEKRSGVKGHWDKEINERKQLIVSLSDESKFTQEYTFEKYYLEIKSEIRNVDAHFVYKKPKKAFETNMEEIKSWLQKSIDGMLVDMGAKKATKETIRPHFEKIFENYECANKKGKNAIDEILSCIFADKGFILKRDDVEQRCKEKEDVLRKLEIKPCAVRELSEELLFVKKKCKNNIEFTTKDLKNHPLLSELLISWAKQNSIGGDSSFVSEEVQLNLLKKNGKKTGYERLKNVIKNQLPKDVLTILKNYSCK